MKDGEVGGAHICTTLANQARNFLLEILFFPGPSSFSQKLLVLCRGLQLSGVNIWMKGARVMKKVSEHWPASNYVSGLGVV